MKKMNSNLEKLRTLTNNLPPIIKSPCGSDYKEYKPKGGHAFSWVLHRVGNDLLVQRWFVTKDSEWDSHSHEGIEVLFITEGKIELFMEGKKFIKSKGDVVYINPNVKHDAKFLEDTKVIVITANPLEEGYTNGN